MRAFTEHSGPSAAPPATAGGGGEAVVERCRGYGMGVVLVLCPPCDHRTSITRPWGCAARGNAGGTRHAPVAPMEHDSEITVPNRITSEFTGPTAPTAGGDGQGRSRTITETAGNEKKNNAEQP